MYKPRVIHVKEFFPEAPPYRFAQIERAAFNASYKGWIDVTVLPFAIRDKLQQDVPWISHTVVTIVSSQSKDTYKAVLQGFDKKRYETVLMANARGMWTLCVSSQIGCAMRCTFCATGTMGLRRSLHADEIVDQYRFWKFFLQEHASLPQRISNVVFMGMGEPLANYENVCSAIKTWLAFTDLGETRITVSTVGVLQQLERLLPDKGWPSVKIAISLHSANEAKRKEIVPTTAPDFLIKLADWSRRYGKMRGNRRHHVTFEYTLIHEVNDSVEHALDLGRYLKTTGTHKLNVIPYNPVAGKQFKRSSQDRVDQFKEALRKFGLTVTQRKTMGDDIAAACGQLVYLT